MTANYKLKQTSKGWTIVMGKKDLEVDGGYVHKEKWKAERRLKAIIEFKDKINGK